MARIKRAVAKRKRKKKFFKLTKGYFGAKSRQYRTVREASKRSGNYAFRDRKARKRDRRIPSSRRVFLEDEILWKAYSSEYGSWVFWLVGVTTAFITSFYMFRLWFMTFFGDYRGAACS